jgi:hypothetical protein
MEWVQRQHLPRECIHSARSVRDEGGMDAVAGTENVAAGNPLVRLYERVYFPGEQCAGRSR